MSLKMTYSVIFSERKAFTCENPRTRGEPGETIAADIKTGRPRYTTWHTARFDIKKLIYFHNRIRLLSLLVWLWPECLENIGISGKAEAQVLPFQYKGSPTIVVNST